MEIKRFLKKCRRVWYSLKKPSREEFEKVSKISAIGILIIGLIGFLISMFMNLFV